MYITLTHCFIMHTTMSKLSVCPMSVSINVHTECWWNEPQDFVVKEPSARELELKVQVLERNLQHLREMCDEEKKRNDTLNIALVIQQTKNTRLENQVTLQDGMIQRFRAENKQLCEDITRASVRKDLSFATMTATKEFMRVMTPIIKTWHDCDFQCDN